MNAFHRFTRVGIKPTSPLPAVLLAAVLLAGSLPATTLLEVSLTGPNASLTWNSVPGNTYEVLSRDSLTVGSWITNDTVIAEGNTAAWTDPTPLVTTRFYRLLMPDGEQTLYEFPPELPPGAPISASLDFFPPGIEPFEGVAARLHGFSGEFVLTSVDLRIPGRGLDFIWARKYRSRLGPDTAQGHGWDFSCNIFVRRVGSDVEVHDGNSRRDIFLLQTNGTFALDGFFREGSISNNAFTLMFADRGTWEFFPFDHPTSPGKIRRSTDRNGNPMEYQYDSLSRLVRVVDPLNRTNTVSYDANGFISAVTDFSGRQVRYEYYGNADPDGSPGDLKLVVSPVVTNTPNANDFPGGKTNRFTYSKGLAPDALNHNLLTVTDGKGQTVLSNRYHTVTNPTNVNYDRVQIPIEIVALNLQSCQPVYVSIAPSVTNNGASKKTIVNDAVGNVGEYYYDGLNRLVMQRQFTGRATPNTPTTETLNRPVSPLRANDPPFFETRVNWNADSQPTQITRPNSNVTQCVYERDLNPSAGPRVRGNLRELHRLPGALGGDQTELVELFDYAPGFGSPPHRSNTVPIPAKGDWNADGTDTIGLYNTVPVTGGWDGISGDTVGIYFNRVPLKGDWNADGTDTIGIYNTVPVKGGAGWNGDGTDTVGLYNTVPVKGDWNNDGTDTVGLYLTQHTDARSNVMTFSYDSRGNRLHATNRISTVIHDWEYNSFGQRTAHVWPANDNGHRRRDEYSYYTSGPQTGYLQTAIVDTDTNALTTTYEYNSLGRVVRHIDPRGHDTLYSVNGLNQVVRATSREVTTGGGIRYQRDYFYDANNNLVRRDVQNRDETGALGANTDFTTTYEYDPLNRRTRSTHEVASGQTLTNEFIYDANGHLTVARSGVAVSGADTNNIVQCLYDERDLLFRRIRGPGGTNQSTAQWDYDANGNLRRTLRGLEGVPRQTDYAYDGYNRLIRGTNAMGSLTTWHYDPNGNVVSCRFDGETNDVAGAAGNLRLSEATYQYDAMNRMTFDLRSFFDVYFQVPFLDGTNSTAFSYSGTSQLVAVTNDNGNATVYAYDSADRLVKRTDARGDSLTYAYDANGNVAQTVAVEKSDLGNPDATFINNYAYDNLDRMTQSVDNASIPNQFAYDSRGNRVLHTDGRGILTRYEYDGLDRLIRSVRDMNGNGPNAAESADIVVSYGYDDASRRVSMTDDNTNTTLYAYDALNRTVREARADSTTNRCTYDARNNLISMTDAQGTVVTNGYDLLDRLNVCRVTTLGAGVTGPTLELFAYDGLSRLVQANSSTAFISRRYDSLGHLVGESQQPSGAPLRSTTAVFDALGNRTQFVYPGGRTLIYTYDALNRVRAVYDNPAGPATLIASNSYVGPRRVERVDYANGTRLDVGYDLARRIAATTHSNVLAATVIDARTYQWDNTDNKTFAQEPAGPHNFGYDAANRMVVSVAPLSFPETYQLDGVGNRQFVNGPVDPGPYTMNPTLPEPADFQANQYTTTPFDGRTYNRNGNLTNSNVGPKNFSYDSHNQLTTFLAPALNATCKYDSLGRRLEKSVNGLITRFYYDGGQVIEEENSGGATTATYCRLPNDIRPGDTISGVSVDNDDAEVVFCSLVQMQRGGNKYFYHADDLGSVMKVTDQTGNIAEQYQYTDFGTPGGPSAIGNPYMFHGMRIEPESQLYLRTSGMDKLEVYDFPGLYSQYIDPRAGRPITHSSTGANNNPASSTFAISAAELNFQTDGPIICQALFQRLAPRPPVLPPPLLGPLLADPQPPLLTDPPTQVRRHPPSPPSARPPVPPTETIPVELVALSLTSMNPITVRQPPLVGTVPFKGLKPQPVPPRVSDAPWVSPGVELR